MSLLDFREIPAANKCDGTQDTFELFAREFFILIGFKIIEGPDRGPDGGRDLIVKETRKGIMGSTDIKWLVSCKHKAHSDNSVTENDEINIIDRVEAFNCSGFIAFYSTVCSSGLNNRLISYKNKNKCEIQIFDHESIERVLLDTPNSEMIISRFFPRSFEKHVKSHIPAKIYSKYYPIKCAVCGEDLLQKSTIKNFNGIVVFAKDIEYRKDDSKEKYISVYCVCKGECDYIMEQSFPDNVMTEWEDISDLTIPIFYLQWVMGFVNGLRDRRITLTDNAFDELKTIILTLAQKVMRNPSVSETERVKSLMELPDWI